MYFVGSSTSGEAISEELDKWKRMNLIKITDTLYTINNFKFIFYIIFNDSFVLIILKIFFLFSGVNKAMATKMSGMHLVNKNLEARVQKLESSANSKNNQIDLLEDLFPITSKEDLEQYEKGLKKFKALREQFVIIFI